MPDFASNPNYIAPVVAPYLGQPSKVALTAAQRANGFVPGMPIAAEHLNSELSARDAALAAGVAATDAITPLARRAAAVAMLHLRQVYDEGAPFSESQDFLAAVSGRTSGHPSVVLKTGPNDVSNIWDFTARESVGSVTSIAFQTYGAARNGVTSGAFRILAIGLGGNGCCYSDNEGYTWTAGSNLGATPHAIVYNIVQARYMVTFAVGVNVAQDVNGASTWASVSTGLFSGQGGIAVLANGTAIAAGLDASGYDDFSLSTNGGVSWSTVGSPVPNFAEIDHAVGEAGWICGDNGPKVYFVGRALGGTELRVFSSTNGTSWTLLATFSPPGAAMGLLFTGAERILMCQKTGLLLVIVEALGAVNNLTVAYASADRGVTWTPPFLFAFSGSTLPTAWAVADGRVFLTMGLRLFASDGIGR